MGSTLDVYKAQFNAFGFNTSLKKLRCGRVQSIRTYGFSFGSDLHSMQTGVNYEALPSEF